MLKYAKNIFLLHKDNENYRILLSELMDISATSIALEANKMVPEEQLRLFEEKKKMVDSGIPVYRALGYRYFWQDKFLLSPETLEPRSDTEVLIEEAIKIPHNRIKKVLDICTGSGCILLSYLRENSFALGIGSDISEGALRTAHKNASTLDLEERSNWVKSDLLDDINEEFDLIFSNPPYIPTKDIDGLNRNVKEHDPYIALDGGRTGLDFYKRLAEQLPRIMHKESIVILEFGYNQLRDILKIFEQFKILKIIQDYNINDRGIILKK